MANDRILKPLFSKHIKKYKIVSFDIETHGKENYFYMVGIQTLKGFKAFYHKQGFKYEIDYKDYYGKVYIVATNLEFDFFGVYGNTPEWKDYEVLMRGGRYIACMKRKQKRKQVFIDTMNYFMCSLATLGKIIGVPKLESPKCIQNDNIGYARKPKDQEEHLELEIYNKRDCEITYEFMIFLQDGVNDMGGKLQITSASTSLDLFRRKYLRKSIKKEDLILKMPDGETVNDFIFESYYGGRTEVFIRGGIKSIKQGYPIIKGWDVNSLYPSVMRNEYPDPSSVKQVYENTTKYIEKFEGVSEVELYCPYMYKPLLPSKIDGKLCFPIGYLKGTYTHVELRKAVSIGYKIIRVNRTLYYKYTFKPFEDYVETLYEKRLEFKKNKNPQEQVIKLFLNSLYGKWGSKKFHESKIFDIDQLTEEEYEYWFENEQNDWKIDTKDNKNFICNKETKVRRPYVIPVLASYTTAYARLLMYEEMEKLAEQGRDVLYMDTDSLFIFGDMENGKELGQMSLDYECDEVIFVKPKMYMYGMNGDFKIRVKGVSKMTSQKFINILKGKSVSYNKFMKTKEGYRRGILPNSVMEVEKYLSLEDSKRDWRGQKFSFDKLQYSQPLEVDMLKWREDTDQEQQSVVVEKKNDSVLEVKHDFLNVAMSNLK